MNQQPGLCRQQFRKCSLFFLETIEYTPCGTQMHGLRYRASDAGFRRWKTTQTRSRLRQADTCRIRRDSPSWKGEGNFLRLRPAKIAGVAAVDPQTFSAFAVNTRDPSRSGPVEGCDASMALMHHPRGHYGRHAYPDGRSYRHVNLAMYI